MSFLFRAGAAIARLVQGTSTTSKAAAAITKSTQAGVSTVRSIRTARAVTLARASPLAKIVQGSKVAKSLPQRLRPAAAARLNRLSKGLTAVRTSGKARTAAKIGALGAAAGAAGAAAATALKTSAAARTAAKIAVIGGTVGAAGLAAGAGVGAGLEGIGKGLDQAVVQPFEDLGLVESFDTNGDGVPDTRKLTNTGKVVLIGILAVIGLGVGAYVIRSVKK